MSLSLHFATCGPVVPLAYVEQFALLAIVSSAYSNSSTLDTNLLCPGCSCRIGGAELESGRSIIVGINRLRRKVRSFSY